MNTGITKFPVTLLVLVFALVLWTVALEFIVGSMKMGVLKLLEEVALYGVLGDYIETPLIGAPDKKSESPIGIERNPLNLL